MDMISKWKAKKTVTLVLPEQHQTKYILVHTTWNLFDLILSNAIMAKMPSSWRYLLTHSTMFGFLCLWGRLWYVSGVLWDKEYGLVWTTCLVLTLVFGSGLICSIPLGGLVCVDKNCAHISERNLPKLESGKTYEAIAKDRLRYTDC